MESAEAKETCEEFRRCANLLEKMKQESGSLSIDDLKGHATHLLFEIDRVIIGGTQEEKEQILIWKQDLLMAPLWELCNQSNVHIDWAEWA